MNRILQKYHNDTSFKQSLKNFFSLGLFQIFNYLFPLITIPYLIRVIGVENFGVVFLAQSFISIFSVIIEYGFNLIATKEIAINKENKNKISEIFSSVYVIKFLLAVLCLSIYTLLIFSIEDFRKHSILFLLSYAIIFSQILIPSWFLQGMEFMKTLVYINGISKLINIILIIIFVRIPDDYYLVNLFWGLGGILVGAYIISWIILKKNINFLIPKKTKLLYYFKESWNTFIMNFSINIYINTSILILKFFADSVSLGYYSVAERILFVVRSILAVFFQSIYPQASQKSKISHEEFKKTIFNFFSAFIFSLFLISLTLFFFANAIIELVSGSASAEAASLLRIFSFIPIIVAFNIPPSQSLIIYNLKKGYIPIFLIAAPLSIGMNILGSYFWGATGTALSVLLTEIFITTALIYTIEYRYPKYSVYKIFQRVSP